MKKILITGGTVFVSKALAQYFVDKQEDVYVLNRNSRKQVKGVKLIECDRNNICNELRGHNFDIVIDVNAYSSMDVKNLLDGLGCVNQYIMISSSAVYPETTPSPFEENMMLGTNNIWGEYGLNKIKAERELLNRIPNAYIIRPPYLYGAFNNIYREAFVFDCALKQRPFYIPNEGEMRLQFFHVKDLCKFIDVLIEKKPEQHIFNVGNSDTISVKDWVELCYKIVGATVNFIHVSPLIEQRNYFCFYNYEYELCINHQKQIYSNTLSMYEGLYEAYLWYIYNSHEVKKKDYFKYIDEFLK